MTTLTDSDIGKNFLAVDKTTWKFETAVLNLFSDRGTKFEFLSAGGSVFYTDENGNSEYFSVYVNDEELEDNFPNS